MLTKKYDEESIDKILDKFKNFNESHDLGNTEQYLIDAYSTDSNICLICIEAIEPKNAIWNCEGCFQSFHIRCIQNWIKDGSYLAIFNSAQNFLPDSKDIPWNCPKCRKDYSQSNYPSIYLCYCKKIKNPEYDPWIIPHSCNQKCGKVKPCEHSCLLLCHPGPCPPCPKIVSENCYCAKSTPVPRRCSNKYWSCDKKCNKLLQCKQHLCAENCHKKCQPCSKTSVQFCDCKKKRKEVSCVETKWKCEEICNKNFNCGFHKCQEKCHENGKCGVCPRSLLRNCPCGKSKFQKPCFEEISTCGDTCNKTLECSKHKCSLRCHFGSCEQCRQIINKTCRCGRIEKEVPCSIELLCENKCNKMKQCEKHKCNRKCCDGNCLPCEQTCNKLLSCKNHKCISSCHAGSCYPCTVIAEIKCPCGESKTKVPCVKSKSEIQVTCKKECSLPSKCHHEKIQKHKCHYGDCPPCSLKCEKQMLCNHKCQSKCHSAVLTEIVENKDRDGPWLALNVKKVLMNLKCEDCTEPIPMNCLGNHEISKVPCYRAKPYNCGRKCGQSLKCTNHTCELECHNFQNSSSIDFKQCEECERPCEQERLKGCIHDCPLQYCHPNKCPDCLKLIKMKCHCMSNSVYIECFKWNTANSLEKTNLKSCQVPCSKTISCAMKHQCELMCHEGPCLAENKCIAKVNLKCFCKTLKKSFICNQIKLETSLIEFRKKENKYFLICNEKCNEKKLKQDKSIDAEKEEKVEKRERSVVFNMRYIVAALFFLFFAIILYFRY